MTQSRAAMSHDLSFAAPWRTAASMTAIFTLEENNNPTDTENSRFQSVCKAEASQQEKSPSLVQVNLKPPQIKEEEERSLSLAQVKLEPPHIKDEQQERSPSLVQVKLESPQSNDEQERSPILVQVKLEHPQVKYEQERSPTLFQVKLEPLIKDEQDKILLSSREAARSQLTLPTVKFEDDDDDREEKALASTSAEHMNNTQAFIEYCVPSEVPSDDRLLSSSESDTDDSDDWESNNNLSQNLTSLKPKPPTKSQMRKKRFCCPDCGKVCGHKGNLQKHMRIHTGERPFACTVCSKRFNRADILKTHIGRFHMSKKAHKKVTCTICNKSFKQSEHLKTHMRIHTDEKPFACIVCNKSFNHTQSLKKHTRTIHTGEKPFACTSCSQSFNRADSLKEHMRIHTGQKSFACTVCSKIFYTNGQLKTHMRKMHTGEKTCPPFL